MSYMTPEEERETIKRSLGLLEQVSGVRPMAVGPLEALDYLRVSLMDVLAFRHAHIVSRWRGYARTDSAE